MLIHTAKSVREDFIEAVEIGRRFPPALPKMPQTLWPEIVRTSSELYAAEYKKSTQVVTATEMKRYETIASWVTFIHEEYVRRILWMIALGYPGWKIAKRLIPVVRLSASTINRKANAAFALIAEKLNSGQTPPLPIIK